MRRWIRITVSLAAAVALHALLLLPLPRKAAPKREPPLRVELVPHLPPTAIAQRPPRKPVHKNATANRTATATANENEHENEIENENEHEHGNVPWSREWSEQEGVAEGGLSLELKNAGPIAASPPSDLPSDEKSVVQRRIEGWASDSKARQRAQVPHEYWRTVREALARGFAPDRGMLVRARPLEGWQRQAEAYGKSGNPFASGRGESARNEARGLDSVSLAGVPQGAINLGAIFSLVQDGWGGGHLLVALVRITQHEDGALFAVELAATSGSPAYDKLALKQARSLGQLHLGAPQQGVITLWAFETDFVSGAHSNIRLEAIY
jgi:hypothetical protein